MTTISRPTDAKDRDLTQQRELYEARPLWADTPRTGVRAFRTCSSSDYDVVVIGAGISGALMTHALSDGRRSVLVADRRKPVRGSTLASTAMIQHEIDIPLHKLISLIGEEKANRAWQRSARAVERLDEIVGDLAVSCSFQRKKTLFLAGEAYGGRAVRKEVAAREAAGIKAELLDGAELRAEYGLDRTAAIRSDISASANPAQMAAGILRQAAARGAEIVDDLEITDIRSAGDRVFLATADGCILGARHVVFCTGYEFLKAVTRKDHAIISTWAIASDPGIKLPDWLSDYLVWEGADPYLYLRQTRDGRLIAGGEDEEDAEAYRSPEKRARKAALIAEKTADLLGCRIGKPAFSWAAPFGTTTTGLPLIGPVPALENVFAVMGFGGNGITFSQIAAEIVSAAINGHDDGDADLFSLGA